MNAAAERAPNPEPTHSAGADCVTDGGLSLPARVTVLVVDIVDSVTLMRRHEAATVRRWAACLGKARSTILPTHHGHMVKSLGDGLMARFDHVGDAIRAAAALHALLGQENATLPADAHIMLRAGINVTEAWTDGIDLYGAGVNVAARLATLAGPGETILSAAARDQITPGVDVECEDLGECYLKSFGDGIRAYRAGPPGPSPLIAPGHDYETSMFPTVAVIPFSARIRDDEYVAVGDLIADGVIDRLSRSPSIKVVSRLSTATFRDRVAELPAVATHLGATFVLSGGYAVVSGRLQISAELAEVRTNHVVWSARLTGTIEDLLESHSTLAQELASAVHTAVFDVEMHHVATQPLPALASYSLLVGSINLMHRSNRQDFERAKSVLEQLIERHGRISTPRAWLASWYVLRTTRGFSHERERDAKVALDATRAALARDPSDAQSMAVEGFVYCHLLKDLATARQRCVQAVSVNPNHAMGWLYLGAINAFEGDGTRAVEATERALELSPTDPQRYYFESLGATARLAANDYPQAESLARSSLRLNRMHSSTWRVLSIALVEQGRLEEARSVMREVRQLEPTLTCRNYLARMPNGALPTGDAWARALAVAGLPH